MTRWALVVGAALSLLHLVYWYMAGVASCPCRPPAHTRTIATRNASAASRPSPSLSIEDSALMDHFRAEHLVMYTTNLFPKSVVINAHPPSQCASLSALHVQNKDQCLAVVLARGTRVPFNLLRFDSTSAIHAKERREVFHLPDSAHMPVGFFLKVNRVKGRKRLKEKIVPLILHFDEIVSRVRTKLRGNGLGPGDDVTVMTLNDGELDLFLNYACSCAAHNVSLSTTMVFSASAEVLPLIEATGAMGVHHEGFSRVAREASLDYIDYTFVDMMWYKAMSLFVMAHLGLHVLFQDVDWVMFRDPFPLIKRKMQDFASASPGEELDVLFSDDGNLSLRYSPFFANSGFYYVRANRRTLQLTWSIVESMDYIQRLGSHQNVLTMRLMELTDMAGVRSKIIPLDELPNGILYHHDRGFMRRMFDREIHPYGFHMCWTKGKPEKLEYFKKSNLWYVSPECSSERISPPNGDVLGRFQSDPRPAAEKLESLRSRCCSTQNVAL